MSRIHRPSGEFFCPVCRLPAGAGACPKGIPITGLDGESYCQSKFGMNWWSAFDWCDAQGMELVTAEDCNGKNGDIEGDSDCPNFNGVSSGLGWTSTIPNGGNHAAYFIELAYGKLNGAWSRTFTSPNALCK